MADLTVDHVGSRGDGVALLEGKPVYLPLTLAGDNVSASVAGGRGEVSTFLTRMPRAEPPCPHFGQCGGCALQHMPESDYAAWKRQRVIDALAKKGFHDVTVAETAISPPGSRRRIALAYETRGPHTSLGYYARRSHRVTDIAICPVADPALTALFTPLKSLLAGLGARSGKVLLTLTDTGIDALITGLEDPGLEARETLADFARKHDLARLSIGEDAEHDAAPPETIAQLRAPVIRLGGGAVSLPPGAFLQATREGEAALTQAVLDWTTGKRVADLFAGCGTFSLPLMTQHQVTAIEGDGALLASLAAAGGGRVTTQERDLFLNPLSAKELASFDTVIIDPPRAGAMAQMQALAASPVSTVVAISCNPSTFARDARILVDGGYRLVEVRPVDQFLWSPHVELAAHFTR